MMRQAAVPGRTRRFPQGFTLIELLVVVAIAAILLTVGVPSYLTTISGYRVANETNALVGDLQYARSEAIKQGVTVSMCISTDGATCSASTNHWEAGHIVLTTPFTGAGAVLRVQAPLTGGDTIREANSVSTIAFNREGFAGIASTTNWNGFTSLPQGLVLTVHDGRNTASIGNCVLVSTVGQISVISKGTGVCT